MVSVQLFDVEVVVINTGVTHRLVLTGTVAVAVTVPVVVRMVLGLIVIVPPEMPAA